MGLGVLATLCSIGFMRQDLHGRNVCIFKSDVLFRHIWTIRIGSYMFELSYMYGVVNRFCEVEASSVRGTYVVRRWIQTHPRFKAFKSSLTVTLQNLVSLEIVITRRGKVLKALCVRLTRSGFN